MEVVQNITLGPMIPSVTVNVSTLNDSGTELEESFLCAIELEPGMQMENSIPNLSVSLNRATITIIDNSQGNSGDYAMANASPLEHCHPYIV